MQQIKNPNNVKSLNLLHNQTSNIRNLTMPTNNNKELNNVNNNKELNNVNNNKELKMSLNTNKESS